MAQKTKCALYHEGKRMYGVNVEFEPDQAGDRHGWYEDLWGAPDPQVGQLGYGLKKGRGSVVAIVITSSSKGRVHFSSAADQRR
jgi:hypothetical protein